MSGLAAVVAKAGEAFASTALAATAFAAFAAAAGRHSAAAPRRGGAPFPALALALSLAQGRELAFDGEGDLLGEGVLRLGLQERAHDGVAGGVLAAATAREGKHLRAAARVLHLRPDPGQARAVGVQLGPRDHDAQELQRQELLQRGRLDPILEAEPGGAYLLAEAHPSRQRCPQRRHIFGSGWVLEELGFGQAVLRRGAGPLGAEIAPEEQAALIAAAGAPKQRVVQRQGNGVVQGEVHLRQIRHAELACLDVHLGLKVRDCLRLGPDQKAAHILPPLAQVGKSPLVPDLEGVRGHAGLEHLAVPAARVDAELAGLALAAARAP